jgi:hypothetical protein
MKIGRAFDDIALFADQDVGASDRYPMLARF